MAKMTLPKTIDPGQRFGRWRALTPVSVEYWLCVCDCGTEKEVRKYHLLDGYTKSCGCSRKLSARVHGQSRTRAYVTWSAMRRRCYNKNCQSYPRYGGRGITVCDRWQYSFENFFYDMGNPPSGMSLERRDNNKGYSPDNCCWATLEQQGNNTRRNVAVIAFGETKTYAEWERDERCVVSRSTLRSRMTRDKWPAEKAITTPPLSCAHDWEQANPCSIDGQRCMKCGAWR
jgi:hypothetical protein